MPRLAIETIEDQESWKAGRGNFHTTTTLTIGRLRISCTQSERPVWGFRIGHGYLSPTPFGPNGQEFWRCWGFSLRWMTLTAWGWGKPVSEVR